MAKAVADTNSSSNQGGFTSDGSPITGFSSMHDSGTGFVFINDPPGTTRLTKRRGEPSLGLFPLFPYSGCVNDTVDGCIFPKKSRATPYLNNSVQASPGFFSLTLQTGINAAMTTSQHAALFRFTFPSAPTGGNVSNSPLIFLDLSDLQDSRQDNGSCSVDESTGRITGYARFLPSFGTGSYTAYFCADFSGSTIRDNGIYVNSRGSTDVKHLTISRSINGYPLPGGCFNRFIGNNPVNVRVGLSFISSEQACQLAETEIPNYDFNATRSAAESAWRKKLSPISVSTNGINDSTLTNFYSGIYRAFVNPQNYTGVNPNVTADQIWFDSFYWYADTTDKYMKYLEG
jgi:putative alpha-1,2-mannosidase